MSRFSRLLILAIVLPLVNGDCTPACLNGGTCNADVCQCPVAFIGSYCQIDRASVQTMLAGSVSGLLGYWPLNSEFSLKDATANGIDGIATGNLLYQPGPYGLQNTAVATRQTNNNYKFQSPMFDFNATGSSMTWAFWVSPGPGNYVYFLGYGKSSSLYVTQNALTSLWTSPGSSGGFQTSWNTASPGWQYMAMTYDNSTKQLKMFGNSSFIKSVTLSVAPTTFNSVFLGHVPPNIYSNASFACLSYYSRALNQTELIQVRNLCSSFSSCTPSCINGGSCTAPDLCTCPDGWTGSYCQTPACNPLCSNGGTCTAPNVCQCAADWSGPGCTTPACSGGCANGGTCLPTNNCSCTARWRGTTCQWKYCENTCANCYFDETAARYRCTACFSGWTGEDCASAICKNNCENGGSCITPGWCACSSGHLAPTCPSQSAGGTNC